MNYEVLEMFQGIFRGPDYYLPVVNCLESEVLVPPVEDFSKFSKCSRADLRFMLTWKVQYN